MAPANGKPPPGCGFFHNVSHRALCTHKQKRRKEKKKKGKTGDEDFLNSHSTGLVRGWPTKALLNFSYLEINIFCVFAFASFWGGRGGEDDDVGCQDKCVLSEVWSVTH